MAFQWQAKSAASSSGVEDMVLLSKVQDSQIVENLQRRYMSDLIYTYIGPVLIAVNPYKSLPYFTEKEIELYHGSAAHENPPHIYALAENMFQNMMIDEENQCAIISGESGAGKTESSKLLMNYISAVSGKGGSAVEETKRIILESNPLLEAFGNSKTLRNNNSSRFGKYFEIQFTRGGQPYGGHISNFLLEKSRVVLVKPGERNFHIFYQLTKGAQGQERGILLKKWFQKINVEMYGVSSPDNFLYLSQSKTFDVDGMNDVEELKEVKHAMGVCGIGPQDQTNLFSIVAGILHLGNITFVDGGNRAAIRDENFLAFPAYLLGVDPGFLKSKLLSRLMTSGGRGSVTEVSLNVQQATNTRDALAKALYSRMFDWIIAAINKAIKRDDTKDRLLSLGVLDIYGFEIFEKNGFEQLCINYVNEKLQQVFIELTLKSEQEEYVREGIQWKPIEYFNNKIVVELIESKRPAGVMAVLDDICIQLHAVTDGADVKFVQKLDMSIGQHPHYQGKSNYFTIKHYAGQVTYDADGFCEANKDTLFRDLIQLAQSTNNPFIRNLFPEDISVDDKKRPTTAGFKIRNQSQELVDTLMKCTPSYIRCIKPNEKKRPREWDNARVEHQVRYLNLRENINVRRAGFCYRNFFEKFLRRYGILTPQTFPQWRGNPKDGVAHLMRAVQMDPGQWQLGATKVFIKNPESLFLLEEMRERKYHEIAVKIQRAYRRYKARKFYMDCKKKVMSLFVGRKERKRLTLNREFLGDYLSILTNPELRALVGKNEKILFCDRILKYDRRWKAQEREIVITEYSMVIVATEPIPKGPEKGKLVRVLKRKIPLDQISAISLSTRCDDFLVIHVSGDFDNVFENVFKTELVTVINNAYKTVSQRDLLLNFTDSIQYSVKKTSWSSASTRTLVFKPDTRGLNRVSVLSNGSSTTEIGVPAGLPKDSQPTVQSPAPSSGYRQSPAQPKTNNSNYNNNNRSSPGFTPPGPSMNSNPPRPSFGQPPSFNNARPPPQQNQFQAASTPNSFRPVSVQPQQQQPQAVKQFGSATVVNRPSIRPSPTAQQTFQSSTLPHRGSNPASVSTPNLTTTMNRMNIGSGSANVPPKPAPPKPKVEQCKSLYDYVAREADELNLRAGDIITLVSRDNEGWWTGILKGKKGLFPANYVQMI